MYESILFPTDGSEGADAALSHAEDIAQQYGATLHVLYVAQRDTSSFGMAGEDHETEHETGMTEDHHEGPDTGMINVAHGDGVSSVEHGQGLTDSVAEVVGDDVSVETEVVTGTPYESILGYAEETDVDLVVMGTHGRTGVDRYLLGSVTEKVVRTSDVPVLTVRMDE
jgi:nucleotide-binding universal stress UspA family protein